MEAKRTIKARQIVNDIRGGLTNLELMAKYQLSAKGLKSLFTKLIDLKAVKDGELDGRVPLGDDTVGVDQRRVLPRNYVCLSLPVCEADDGSGQGYVRDITEQGLQVASMAATVGEDKSLVLYADCLDDIPPFVLKAQCRWATPPTDHEEALAGFEITDISQQGLRQLKKLIDALTLGSPSGRGVS